MAEKGGTKIMVIVTLCIILISISFSGCFEEDDDKTLKETDPIKIRNGLNESVEVFFTIWDKNDEIVKDSNKILNPNEVYKISFKSKYEFLSITDSNNHTLDRHKIELDRFYVVLEDSIQLVIVPI